MRISRENVAKREAHVRTLLSTNPDLSVKEINASLTVQAEFGGHKMAPGRITAIRKSLSGIDTGTITVTPNDDLHVAQVDGQIGLTETATVTIGG